MYLATNPQNSAWTSQVVYTTQCNAELGRYQLRSAKHSTSVNYLLWSGAN